MTQSEPQTQIAPPRAARALSISRADWDELARRLGLSGRELQIVQCIFEEHKEAAIARCLGISQHTIHTHLGRLYRKLDTSSRCGVVLRVFSVLLEVSGRTGSQQPPCESL